jgi:NADH-quinone oxidoreductase subunit L
VAGLIVAFIMYMKKRDLPEKLANAFRAVHSLLYNKYWIDELYDRTIVRPALRISDTVILGFFDGRIIEGIVNGLPSLIGRSSQVLRKLQTGLISSYAFMMALGVLLIIALVLF